MKVLIAFVKFSVLATLGSATNYCDFNTEYCASGSHIGCGNWNQFGSYCPEDAIFHDLSDVADAIVRRHNWYRNEVAGGWNGHFPKASRMATMTWDSELAYLAGLNVKRCFFGYEQCHDTPRYRFSGQSLGSMSKYGDVDILATARQNIDNWFAEHKYATVSHLRQYGPSNGIIGQFTIMVTDRNNAVGCAAAEYGTTVLMACNYATINIEATSGYTAIPVYEFGEPTSACETGSNPDDPNLCSEREYYDLQTFNRYLA